MRGRRERLKKADEGARLTSLHCILIGAVSDLDWLDKTAMQAALLTPEQVSRLPSPCPIAANPLASFSTACTSTSATSRDGPTLVD